MTPDVSVLLAASRSDHPHHRCAMTWLDQALGVAARGSRLRLLPMVAACFLRLAPIRACSWSPRPWRLPRSFWRLCSAPMEWRC
jgi:hypothetical protein